MLDALYSVIVLAETGVLTYMTAKLGIDYAWEKTVKYITNNDLWEHPDVKAFMKEKV